MRVLKASHKLNQKSPIIVIGMHRSGTSMITRVLDQLGLFVGDEKQDDHESIFFLNLNDEFLASINQHWDLVEQSPIQWSEAQVQKLAKVAVDKLMSKKFSHYSKSVKSIDSIDSPWGWKDPRNTLTFDIWKYIFPEAKVIHIYRNPIDVAVSLQSRFVRSQGLGNLLRRMKIKIPRAMERINWERRIKHQWNPAALVNLDRGIELSRKYLTAAENISLQLPKRRYYEMCYEDFLEEPITFIRSIVEFVGLNPSEEEIQNSLIGLNASRKFAFTSDDKLCDLYTRIRNEAWMKKWGYDNIL